MMYFSKITLRPDAPPGRLASLAAANAYIDHAALWRLFSAPDRKHAADAPPRSFLFHRIETERLPSFYVLSRVRPEPASDLWAVDIKEFEPRLRNGMRLQFLLRANPVVTQTDARGRHLRRDVVMARKHALKQQGIPPSQWPAAATLVQEECVRWLQARTARCGFALVPDPSHPAPFHLHVRTSAYRQHVLHKRGAPAPVRFSTVDFAGLLEITDVQAFRTALFNGIGPAKGFGCGLLLIKPAPHASECTRC